MYSQKCGETFLVFMSKSLRRFKLDPKSGPPYGIMLHPMENHIFTISGKKIIQMNVQTGSKEIVLDAHENQVMALTKSYDKKFMVSAGVDGEISIWNLDSDKLEKTKTFEKEHTHWIKGLITSHDDKYVFTGSGDQTAKMWEVTVFL